MALKNKLVASPSFENKLGSKNSTSRFLLRGLKTSQANAEDIEKMQVEMLVTMILSALFMMI